VIERNIALTLRLRCGIRCLPVVPSSKLAPRDSIYFNNREYTSWSSARDQANKKLATAKAGTVWGRGRIEYHFDHMHVDCLGSQRSAAGYVVYTLRIRAHWCSVRRSTKAKCAVIAESYDDH
jgi:hypothetical protein